jgi:subtilisin family serine protease
VPAEVVRASAGLARVRRRGASRRRLVRGVVAAALTLLLLLLAGAPAGAIENTWTAKSADLVGASDLASGGRGITVAVLDSWVDSRHPDFGGHVLSGATCNGGACRPGGTDVPDTCEAHGTHVAGLVGSARFGVAPEARILPVRVLNEKNGACQAEANDVANGVRYAASHGAQVINISLGSTYALTDKARAIPRAVADASHQGVVVVVAAGNGQAPGVDVYGDDALVVAATGPNGQLASYSQRGTGVDLAAPGGQPKGDGCTPEDCVVSTWSDRSYAADAGTSMAAPIVAGAAALLLAQRPDRGRDDVVATLKRTAHPLAGAGSGRVDVLAALRGSIPTGNGTDGVNAPPAAKGGPAGPASAEKPSAARVIRPDGSVENPSPSTSLAGAQRPQTRGILLWTGVALVLLVVVALVVVARTQGALAGGGRAEDDGFGGAEDARYDDDADADDHLDAREPPDAREHPGSRYVEDGYDDEYEDEYY